MTEARSVTTPPAGEAAAVPDGPGQGTGAQSVHPFCAGDPAAIMPPPPRGGEDAPPQDSEADSDDNDGRGGRAGMTSLWLLTAGAHSETLAPTKIKIKS
eukprot:1338581-Pyramimonas_sp.AAC.1